MLVLLVVLCAGEGGGGGWLLLLLVVVLDMDGWRWSGWEEDFAVLAVAPSSSSCCWLRIVEAAEAAVVELSSLDDVAVMMNYCFFDSILLSRGTWHVSCWSCTRVFYVLSSILAFVNYYFQRSPQTPTRRSVEMLEWWQPITQREIEYGTVCGIDSASILRSSMVVGEAKQWHELMVTLAAKFET